MTDFSKFRSALSGFNRSDVANYIEALCAEHQKQLKAEKEEREAILEQLNTVRRTLELEEGKVKAAEAELAETKAALEETQKMLEEALEMEPDAPDEDYGSLELEEALEMETALWSWKPTAAPRRWNAPPRSAPPESASSWAT